MKSGLQMASGKSLRVFPKTCLFVFWFCFVLFSFFFQKSAKLLELIPPILETDVSIRFQVSSQTLSQGL